MTSDKSELPFSFAGFAEDFESHIHKSIRGYGDLRADCIGLSQYFVDDETTVLDIGCSTGQFLNQVRSSNETGAPNAAYIGIDVEESFQKHWDIYRADNLEFIVSDVRKFDGFENLSFVTSLFSLQFIPEKDRRSIMQKIYAGLVDGGALVVAEKTLSQSSKIQDMMTFMYYDFKSQHFSEAELLRKEQSLRDKMKLWSEGQIVEMLVKAGFQSQNIQPFWRNHLFVGMLAVKGISI